MKTFFMLFIWLFFGIICSKIAQKKYRSKSNWFYLGLLFGALALIIILFLKPLKIIENKISPIEINDNNFWYYLDHKENQIGPVSLHKIFDSYQNGLVNENTFVWNDTMEDWKKIKEINSISNIFN
jgi:hypothetical protein